MGNPTAPQDVDSIIGEAAPPPFGVDRELWMLDPEIAFLNHGSFGAVPRSVAAAQSAWRARIEARPIAVLGRQCRSLIARAREVVAALVGADGADIGFVTNATEGVNVYLAGVPLAAGDEIITTDHVYNAVRQAMRHRAEAVGASMREVPIALPIDGPDAVFTAVAAALTDRTRLLVVDHVTSPTALVFPIERLAQLCASRNIDLLVDGAHAPGMLPLELSRLGELGVGGYAANLHKWVCAPKGSAFLWVRRDRQARVHPLVISHFLGDSFGAEFDWQGTRDITPWLCSADAIAFLESFGLDRLLAHNRAMARWVQRTLCARWAVEPNSPAVGSMLGSMATVPLPEPLQPARRFAPGSGALPIRDPHRIAAAEAFMTTLVDRFAIEVPLIDFGDRWHVRPCCQVYNSDQEYRRLGEAIATLADEACDGR